jgi:hypothetical protein
MKMGKRHKEEKEMGDWGAEEESHQSLRTILLPKEQYDAFYTSYYMFHMTFRLFILVFHFINCI